MRAAVIELVAFFILLDFHSRVLGLRDDHCQLAHRLVDTQPEFSGMEICDHRGHSAEVVGIKDG